MKTDEIIEMLLELKNQADEVEASTGIQPSAQEALTWAVEFIQMKTYPTQKDRRHQQPQQQLPQQVLDQ